MSYDWGDSKKLGIFIEVIVVGGGEQLTHILQRSASEATATPTPSRFVKLLQIHRDSAIESFEEACNAGAAAARGEILIFLNNTLPIRTSWLRGMLSLLRPDWAELPAYANHGDNRPIGIVGGRIVDAEGYTYHAGVDMSRVLRPHSSGSVAEYDMLPVFRRAQLVDPPIPRALIGKSDVDILSCHNSLKDVVAVSLGCLMIERALFRELGNFSSELSPYAEIDYGLRCLSAGRRVVYYPCAQFVERNAPPIGIGALAAVDAVPPAYPLSPYLESNAAAATALSQRWANSSIFAPHSGSSNNTHNVTFFIAWLGPLHQKQSIGDLVTLLALEEALRTPQHGATGLTGRAERLGVYPFGERDSRYIGRLPRSMRDLLERLTRNGERSASVDSVDIVIAVWSFSVPQLANPPLGPIPQDRWKTLYPAALLGTIDSVQPSGIARAKQPVVYHVARTDWPTNRVPPQYVAALNHFDELWVSSEFSVKSLRRSGVHRPLVCVPPAVDVDHVAPLDLSPDVRPLPQLGMRQPAVHMPSSGGIEVLEEAFSFLASGPWTPIHGWTTLLTAYLKEFDMGNDKVSLFIRTDPMAAGLLHDEVVEEIKRTANESAEATHRPLERLPRVQIFLGPTPEYADLPRLLRGADAYVTARHGDAVGRDLLEAIAAQVPTIAPLWGAASSFMNVNNSIPVEVTGLTTIGEIAPYTAERWADVSVDKMRTAMRFAYDQRAEARARARIGSMEIASLYNLENVGAWVLNRVASIVEAHSLR